MFSLLLTGFYNSFYVTECTDGLFGENCKQTCHCENNDVCNKIYGTCPTGVCSPGYEEEDSSCQTSKLRLTQLSKYAWCFQAFLLVNIVV